MDVVFAPHDTDFYTSPDRASVALSALTVAAFGVVMLPGLVALAFARMRAASLLAEDAARAEAGADLRPLRPGHAVLRGDVVGEPDSEVVTIRIRQAGRTYQTKGGMRHQWTEVDREVVTRPFQLRLASGECVSVDAGRDVLLVDGLLADQGNGEQRSRFAVLRTGQRIYAEGHLTPIPSGGAYRAGAQRFTLGRSAAAPLLLSVEPLERRHEKRAALQRSSALWLLAAALLVNAAVYGAFWAGTFGGTVQSTRIDGLKTWVTTSKGRSTTHYGVLAALEDGASPARHEISRAAYLEASSERARGNEVRVPFEILPAGLGAYVGERPSLHVIAVSFSWLLAPFVVVIYVVRVRHARPWFERPRVVDDGAGPLGAPDTLV